jgi:hypothetical protein
LPLVAHHDKVCTPQKHQMQKIKLENQLSISKSFFYDADDGDDESFVFLSIKSPQVFELLPNIFIIPTFLTI